MWLRGKEVEGVLRRINSPVRQSGDAQIQRLSLRTGHLWAGNVGAGTRLGAAVAHALVVLVVRRGRVETVRAR